ncbi:ion channel [Undibacterium sp. Dicai25W]|uniref:ion channel n=1 Tax=Undibacterium sp. Dicai25W TaxID=3413034 RepID=UPI003BF12406
MKLFSKHPQRARRISMAGREVVTYGLDSHIWQDIYYYAMSCSWPRFFGAIAVTFVLFNLVFAGLFMLVPNSIANMQPNNFLGAYFFSVETLATVGYGDMHPMTVYGHAIASIEIFVGMASVAVTTGMIFARFSRPRSSIIFAEHPVSHVADGKRLLMVRMANARLNLISEASAKMHVMRQEQTSTMGQFRKIYDLKLERDHHPLFVLGWTLIHIIDETSPLFGLTPEQMSGNTTLIVTIEGVDDTTNQNQRGIKHYPSDLIRWNHRYVDMLNQQGSVPHLHYTKFHDSEEVPVEVMKDI